jgi:hypothetical protein
MSAAGTVAGAAAARTREIEGEMGAALPLLRVVAASLPPPPEPNGGGQGGVLDRPLLLAAGLAIAVLLAFGAGLLVGRARIGQRSAARRSLAALRLELWHNGEATILGYAGDPAGGDHTFACHLARLRAAGAPGALVLIDPVPDAIVALVPVQPEPPPQRARRSRAAPEPGFTPPPPEAP